MIRFVPKTFSSTTDEIVEGVTGAGVLGGTAYGTYMLNKARDTKKFIRTRVKAENLARELRDKLSSEANKARVIERLKNHPEYKKNLKKGKIGLGIAIASGLGYGFNEKLKNIDKD